MGALQALIGSVLRLGRRLHAPVYFGRSLANVPAGSLVVFPLRATLLGCGISGIVAFKRQAPTLQTLPVAPLSALAERVRTHHFDACQKSGAFLADTYLGGGECIAEVLRLARECRRPDVFCALFGDATLQARVDGIAVCLAECLVGDVRRFDEQIGRLPAAEADLVSQRIEHLKDAVWCLRSEVLGNITKVRDLLAGSGNAAATVKVFRDINAVLNSIDRMEVRGRDSAGISLLFALGAADYEHFSAVLGERRLQEEFARRLSLQPLLNQGIAAHRHEDTVAVTFTYKVAVEIGSLGDNIRFLRRAIAGDPLLNAIVAFPAEFHTVNAHTRWASVGAITEANCHPVDNRAAAGAAGETGIIHACLNGDIDNFHELKEAFERSGGRIHADITTDTKIIPLQIEHYLRQGFGVAESFRRAVGDFKGSHAIAMHTSLAPGKLFLAQRGSGQAIFVGIAPDLYMATSEVYGFIEETSAYVRLDGESVVDGKAGKTQGQLFVLDQQAAGRPAGDHRHALRREPRDARRIRTSRPRRSPRAISIASIIRTIF